MGFGLRPWLDGHRVKTDLIQVTIIIYLNKRNTAGQHKHRGVYMLCILILLPYIVSNAPGPVLANIKLLLTYKLIQTLLPIIACYCSNIFLILLINPLIKITRNLLGSKCEPCKDQELFSNRPNVDLSHTLRTMLPH